MTRHTIPDGITPIRGIRLWEYTPTPVNYLTGISYVRYHWQAGVNTAHCNRTGGDRHVEPHVPGAWASTRDHECGLHVYHGGEVDRFAEREHRVTRFTKKAIVPGVVEAWGRITVHDYGFRAQYARIVALAQPKWMGPHRVRELQSRYPGVPFYPSLEAAMTNHLEAA